MFSLRSITLDGTDACTAVRSGKALSTLLTPGIQLRPKSSTRYSLVFSLECPTVDATTTGTGVPLGEVPSTLLTSRYPDYVLPITRTTYEKHKNQKHKCKGVGGMGGSPSIRRCTRHLMPGILDRMACGVALALAIGGGAVCRRPAPGGKKTALF